MGRRSKTARSSTFCPVKGLCSEDSVGAITGFGSGLANPKLAGVGVGDKTGAVGVHVAVGRDELAIEVASRGVGVLVGVGVGVRFVLLQASGIRRSKDTISDRAHQNVRERGRAKNGMALGHLRRLEELSSDTEMSQPEAVPPATSAVLAPDQEMVSSG